jgi:hypothetical protein
MPVERPWGELLVHAGADLAPFVAVAANIESLHRMTREERDLRGLMVHGSDHLTAYNVYAEAVNHYGHMGLVYGLPRHLFAEELEEWAEGRGVLVKAIEDVALGTASVYRTLDLPLPEQLPPADAGVLRRFRDLVARFMPFDLAMDGHLASGESARVSKGSMCSPWGAVAGTVRYFADRFGVPRGAIEGTNLPLELIRRYAVHSPPSVELHDGKRAGLSVVRRTEYAGFELAHQRGPLPGRFPEDLAPVARDALAQALTEGRTPHRNQPAILKAVARLTDYWKKSGGRLEEAEPTALRRALRQQLETVDSWEGFLAAPVALDVGGTVPEPIRRELDALPGAVRLLGDRVPLIYELERGRPTVRLRLKEGQARRLRPGDLPILDRPLRLSILRGRGEVLRVDSLEELRAGLERLPRRDKRPRRR